MAFVCGNNGSLPGHERAGSELRCFQGTSCRINLSKATGYSDSQNAILETTENTSTQEIEVRKWFCTC